MCHHVISFYQELFDVAFLFWGVAVGGLVKNLFCLHSRGCPDPKHLGAIKCV